MCIVWKYSFKVLAFCGSLQTPVSSLVPNIGRQTSKIRLPSSTVDFDPFSAASAVTMQQSQLPRAELRKLRSSIEGIARDQEELRLSTPLMNAKTTMKTATAVIFGLIATGSVGLGTWSVGLLPALTSVLFIYTSAAESSGQRSKSIARYNSAQAVNLAASQETALAEADARKAFLPFGVGLTAIFAAACVSLKLFLERVEELATEGQLILAEPAYYLLDVIVIFAALVAVTGAVFTNVSFVNMETALNLRDEDRNLDDENEWEAKRLPKDPRQAEEWQVNVTIFVSVFLCLLPIPFVLQEFNFQTFGTGLNYVKETAVVIHRECVVVSAIAGAQAALCFLVAEKEFSDAERRISKQSKQAALSELFFAQTLAETVVMPARSAWSGFALAVATLAVEFSTIAASIWSWPMVLSSFRSLLGARLASVEADAAYLERKISRKGDAQGKKTDVVSSTIRDLQRAIEQLIKQDGFPEKVRENLLQLPLGAKREFTMLNSESRRQVHAVAAELGMFSQSLLGERAVSVINFSDEQRQRVNSGPLAILQPIDNAWQDLRRLLTNIVARGIPASGVAVFLPAVVSTTASVASFSLLADTYADVVVPVATGGVALATVWQERSGKAAVAEAKRDTAILRQRVSDAESSMGMAGLSMSALPTYLAITTSATAMSVVCFVTPVSHMVGTICTVTLTSLCAWVCLLAVERQRRIVRSCVAAADVVEAPRPPLSFVNPSRWWLIPVAVAAILPLDLPRRFAVMCCAFAAEVGIIFADSGSQMAATSFYVARAARVFSRADAWTQEAGTECRALPLNSATAIINTLLATALIAFDTPLNVLFPIVGLLVCVQALQSGSEAQGDAATAEKECESIQELGTDAPPFLARAAATETQARRQVPAPLVDAGPSEVSRLVLQVSKDFTAKLKREGRDVNELFDAFTLGTGEIQWQDFRSLMSRMSPELSIYEIERLWKAFDLNEDGGISRREFVNVLYRGDRRTRTIDFPKVVKSIGLTLLRVWEEPGPDVAYEQTAAEKAVDSVQKDIAEVNVTARTREDNFFSTAGTVGVLTITAVVAPFVLSEIATEVCLPVVGAILTIFAVSQESDARRTVAASKVWAAELNEIAASQEELLSMSSLYKSRLLGVTGMSVAVGVTTVAVEETFEIFHHYSELAFIQEGLQWGLIGLQAIIVAYSVRRLLRVRSWTRRVLQTSSSLRQNMIEEATPVGFFNGQRTPISGGHHLTLLAMLPTFLLAFFPAGRHFPKRAVASTAAGAVVVAVVLFFAEMSVAQAERAQAARSRTYALADAFANSAEQQGAILPLASAATIAGAALVTFVTEVQPFLASAITLIQVMAWLVASRKSLTAKFQSQAALQVNLVSLSPPEDTDQTKETFLRRMRKKIVRWLSSSQSQQLTII